MYLRAALLLIVLSAATGTVSSCRLSGGEAQARDPFRREYSDQEWLAMVTQCEHQPRILWKGTSIDSFNESGWSVNLDGLLFYGTPARVLDYQLSKGLLSRRPRLFLPLFDAEDATVVLTGIYSYGLAGHVGREDAASIKAALRQTLGHIDTRVRCSAIETLARKDWLGVDDVRRGLKDDALIVRNITASYLGSVVRNELADTSPLPMTQQRARAIQQRLATVLLDHLNDTYFFVRFKCATTFLDLFPRSNRPAWFPWDKADWHSRVRMQQEWKAWWAQQGKRVLHVKRNGDSRYSTPQSAGFPRRSPPAIIRTLPEQKRDRPCSREPGNRRTRLHPTALQVLVKRRAEISVPAPAYRLVFLDEGRVTPDSYAIHYTTPSWWDPPFVRHGDGTNVAFADGHSDYWKYTGKETIQIGKMVNPQHNYAPTTEDGLADLQKMQIATWGRLGY